MSDNVSNPSPLNPNQRPESYQQEYRQGADLFQQALQGFDGAENPEQKAAYQNVMDQAIQVMNDAARALKGQYSKDMQKINADYASFENSQSVSQIQKLQKDLDQAKER